MGEPKTKPPSRPGLDHQIRHLVSISALAALGRGDDLSRYLTTALQAGVPDAMIQEVLLEIVLFAGFPRGITALEALRAAATDAGKRPAYDGKLELAGETADLRGRGRELFLRIYPRNAEEVLAHLGDLHPLLPDWTLTSAYGQILSRGQIPTRLREFVAVAALAALEQYGQLLAHMRGAVHAGGTTAELKEVLSQLSLHLDEGVIDKAYRLLERA